MKYCRTMLLSALLACSLTVSAMAAEPATTVPPVAETIQKPSETVVSPPPARLGHVDIARIAAESERAKTEQAQVGELKKKLQGQIESKRKQLEKLQSSLEAKLKTLSPPQREAKAKEFQKKVEEFQKFGMNAEKELQAKQEELSDKLLKAIEQASTEVGKAKNLALVIIKRELLYLANGVDAQDVTEDVIKKIDKK